ncbi:MAG: hypothetical protein QRY72_03265 [Candidatus Rhabdochlamydia sp.]
MEEKDLIDDLSGGLRFEDFRGVINTLFSENNCKQYQTILKKCFDSKDKLDQSEKYDFDIEVEDKMLAYIERVGDILRNSNEDFSQTIDEITKIVKVITAERGDSSNGSNPSSPQPSPSFLTD